MKRGISMVAWVAAAAFVLALTAYAGEDHEHKDNGPTIGEPAPQFELKDAEGKIVKLSDYKGQIVVLHFQSCTCPWEIAYQPSLEKVSQQYAFDPIKVDDKGDKVRRVQFIGINANKTEDYEQIGKTVKKFQISYPILKDPDNVVADQYKAATTPHIYIITPDGKVAYNGAIDSIQSSKVDDIPKATNYVAAALTHLKAGKAPDPAATVPYGCDVKY